MENINKNIKISEYAFILIIVSIIGLISNHTYQYTVAHSDMGILSRIIHSPLELLSGIKDGAIGMLYLYIICIIGLLIAKYMPFYLPSIAWISIVAIIASSPISPVADNIMEYTDKIGVLPLTTAILAYAGYAIADKEIEVFKHSGIKIIIVSLLVFIGTFLGSAIISAALLSLTGV